jgi:hypothetical protein
VPGNESASTVLTIWCIMQCRQHWVYHHTTMIVTRGHYCIALELLWRFQDTPEYMNVVWLGLAQSDSGEAHTKFRV